MAGTLGTLLLTFLPRIDLQKPKLKKLLKEQEERMQLRGKHRIAVKMEEEELKTIHPVADATKELLNLLTS